MEKARGGDGKRGGGMQEYTEATAQGPKSDAKK